MLLKALADAQVNLFLSVCDQINFPVSLDKTFFESMQVTFLGMLIDSVRQLVLLPKEKIDKARMLLMGVLEPPKKKLTVKQLQQICGFLNFLGQSILLGHAFTCRLYAFNEKNSHLLPHHHVRITSEMRADLAMWFEFMKHLTIYAREFIDFSRYWEATKISIF